MRLTPGPILACSVGPNSYLSTAPGRSEPATVSLDLPPANYDASEHTARVMGRSGAHLALHYILLGGSYYIWWNHGTSPDPGGYIDALSSRTGIEVTLAASSQTATANATATASAVDGTGSMTASSDGVTVTVVGASAASAGPVTFATRGREGIIGTPDNRAFTDLSSLTQTIRGAALDATSWGSVPIVITGFALGIGTSHSNPIVVSVYQGGSAGDPGGATLLGHIGSTSGGANTSTIERVASAGVYADPDDGLIWIMLMNAAGVRTMYTYASRNGTTGHNWTDFGAGNRIAVPGNDTTSSDPADLPATLTTGDSADDATGMPAIQLSFVEATAFQSNMAPTFDFGTMAGIAQGERDSAFEFAASTDLEFVAGNAYDIPATMRGLELYSLTINYAVHTSGEDLAGHFGVGGDALGDWGGATVYHVGPAGAGGTATGWVSTDVAAEGIPLTESTRVRLLIESGDDTSENAFDTSTPNIFSADVWGDASWYQGNTSESGYEPGTTSPTTNLSFDGNHYGLQDAHDASTSPGPWVVTPDGDLVSDNNNAGIYGTAITRGFSVA